MDDHKNNGYFFRDSGGQRYKGNKCLRFHSTVCRWCVKKYFKRTVWQWCLGRDRLYLKRTDIIFVCFDTAFRNISSWVGCVLVTHNAIVRASRMYHPQFIPVDLIFLRAMVTRVVHLHQHNTFHRMNHRHARKVRATPCQAPPQSKAIIQTTHKLWRHKHLTKKNNNPEKGDFFIKRKLISN